MAVNADERTEPPTPRRRTEARAKGQVARSQDLTAAVLLLAGFLAMALLGPSIWHSMLAVMRTGLEPKSPVNLDEALQFAAVAAAEMIRRLAPYLLILLFTGFAVMYAQVGPLLTLQPLTPTLSKLNPLRGFQRLFSIRSVMTAVMNLGKLFVVGLVAYLVIAGSAPAILLAFTLDFADLFWLGAHIVFRLALALTGAFLLLAFLDLAWQRYRHERDLRMTKEEVKDELRSMEGDPAIKRRRRQIQLQLAMQRLKKDVPEADVVVTNPTHVAVAIRYDSATMSAPQVVAKGADRIALRIREIAAVHGIPIVERKPLARALFETVEVGQYIPEQFFRAIAEILAYVYELTGRSPVTAKRQPVGV